MCVMCKLEEVYSDLEDLVKDELKDDETQNLIPLIASSHLVKATMLTLAGEFENVGNQMDKAHEVIQIISSQEECECPSHECQETEKIVMN
jgi:hypothetical protein